MYTKECGNVVIHVEMWYTFCIHQLYTSCTTPVCIQNVYTVSVWVFKSK